MTQRGQTPEHHFVLNNIWFFDFLTENTVARAHTFSHKRAHTHTHTHTGAHAHQQ